MRSACLAVFLLGVWACAGGGEQDDAASMSKDFARSGAGKADDGRDVCDQNGWYGDGECDNFCPEPDLEDCPLCGGPDGASCGERGYCRYSAAEQCGAADDLSVCLPRPDACTMIYRPVCGCDGQTYSNECQAARAGQSVLLLGECPTEDGGA